MFKITFWFDTCNTAATHESQHVPGFSSHIFPRTRSFTEDASLPEPLHYLSECNHPLIFIWSHSKMSVISISRFSCGFSLVFMASPDNWIFLPQPVDTARDVKGNSNLPCAVNQYTNNSHSLLNVLDMHRKAINPVHELIWSTSAYLFWRSYAFTNPLGRSKVVNVSKPDNILGCTDCYFRQAINCYGINAGLLSLIVGGIASFAGFANCSDSSPHCTASNAESILHTWSRCCCYYVSCLLALCILVDSSLRDCLLKGGVS